MVTAVQAPVCPKASGHPRAAVPFGISAVAGYINPVTGQVHNAGRGTGGIGRVFQTPQSMGFHLFKVMDHRHGQAKLAGG